MTYTVPKGVFYVPDCDKKFPAGSTILIQAGDYDESSLLNLKGTAEARITIMFEGKTRLGYKSGARYGLNLSGEYFDVIGNKDYSAEVVCGDAGRFLNSGISVGNSSDYTISYMKISLAQVGFFGNPTSGRLMKNISFYRNKISLTGNPSEQDRCEAFYLGSTSGEFTSINAPYRFQNLLIVENELSDLMGDGIQVSICENLTIKDNIINGYGKNNLDSQMHGIQIGGGCYNVLVDGNKVSNGNGIGLFAGGCGKQVFSNNVFTNCGQSDLGNQDIIYIANKTPDMKTQSTSLTGNTITGGKRNGVNNTNSVESETPGSQITDNVITAVAGQKWFGNIKQATIKTAKQTITLYSDGTYESK